ncbi:Uncharacterised protein [Yersinia pseudotuberculosis]|nr:Uncharacterised protein [Yersinia pseudotuberculosis]SUP89202.1 Uncharacterised protein [Yersinia pseudotuberculosis]
MIIKFDKDSYAVTAVTVAIYNFPYGTSVN